MKNNSTTPRANSRLLGLSLSLCMSSFALSGAAQAQRLTPPAAVPSHSGIVTQVQSNDAYRVNAMEEEMRRLNGKIEELNFLLLQLQEKLRKMEEDNEGRFQELESKRSSIEQPETESPEAQNKVAEAPSDMKQPEEPSLGKPETSAEPLSSDEPKPAAPNTEETATNAARSLEPRALGTLTFDKDGNVIDTQPSSQGTRLEKLPGVFDNGVDGSVEASQFGTTPTEVFKVAKAALDARHYKRSEQAFAAFLKAWPEDPDAGEAKYYLGESMFWQKNYYAAADLHLDAHNNYPEAKTAADNLLGLGLSLAGLNQREVACATYAEVLKQYPETTARLGERVKDEQAAARC